MNRGEELDPPEEFLRVRALADEIKETSGGAFDVVGDCVSVSVVADSCAEADAWATELMVLGVEEGRPLAQRLGLRAYFVRRLEDGGFEELAVE